MKKEYELENFSSKEKIPWIMYFFGWIIEKVLRVWQKNKKKK